LKSQFWSDQKLIAYQNSSAASLFDEIKKGSSYYKPFMVKTIDENKNYLDHFKTFPFLYKDVIKQRAGAIYNKQDGIEFKHITSGSTGDPLTIICDGRSEAYRTLQRLRFYSWWGVHLKDRNVLIWGQLTQDKSTDQIATSRGIKEFIFKKDLFIKVFDLNLETIHTIYKQVLQFKPVFLRGYTSAIYQFASLIDQKGLDGTRLKLKVIITTSEVLFADHKAFIERVFNTRVADEYGAAEVGLIAYDCPHGSKHICEEDNYIYPSDNNEIVITNLHNRSMPLINYKIGDRVLISPDHCDCGRTSRVIKSIEGRLGDMVMKENGDYISQYLFYYAVKDLDNMGLHNSIFKYKIIQRDLYFDLYFVKGTEFKDQAIEFIKARMYELIGTNIAISIHFVDEIPIEKSGKLRFFQRL
jgi:phenylacetate-CoA ligase